MISGGIISASTFGSGDGGSLTITAESVLVDRKDSRIFTGIRSDSRQVNGGEMAEISPLNLPICSYLMTVLSPPVRLAAGMEEPYRSPLKPSLLTEQIHCFCGYCCAKRVG